LKLERFPQLRTIARGTFDDADWFRADAQISAESAQQGVVTDTFDVLLSHAFSTPHFTLAEVAWDDASANLRLS
jgi:hypothetical protein